MLIVDRVRNAVHGLELSTKMTSQCPDWPSPRVAWQHSIAPPEKIVPMSSKMATFFQKYLCVISDARRLCVLGLLGSCEPRESRWMSRVCSCVRGYRDMRGCFVFKIRNFHFLSTRFFDQELDFSNCFH